MVACKFDTFDRDGKDVHQRIKDVANMSPRTREANKNLDLLSSGLLSRVLCAASLQLLGYIGRVVLLDIRHAKGGDE